VNKEHPSETPAWHLDEPFWRSTRVFGESLFFVRERSDVAPQARLLFPPAGEVRLTSAMREVLYEIARDYCVDTSTGVITLPEGSRIPFKNRADLYCAIGSEHCMGHKTGDENVGLYFGEGRLFHDQQAVASYAHDAPWSGSIPAAQPERLPRVTRKFKEGSAEPLKICIIGDSISTGCNASAVIEAPPFQPAYPELLVDALRAVRTGTVTLENFAVSGTGMKHGLTTVEAAMNAAPDLVILAYGMNDAGFNPVAGFRAQAEQILATIRKRSGGAAETVLVAPMLGNDECFFTPQAKFPAFRDALASLCGPGVALADLTQLWADMLKVKSYLDLTGNGVNHPNDFGQLIHAQVLLDVLGVRVAAV
jgi:lysophospholipase L1-like esterase